MENQKKYKALFEDQLKNLSSEVRLLTVLGVAGWGGFAAMVIFSFL